MTFETDGSWDASQYEGHTHEVTGLMIERILEHLSDYNAKCIAYNLGCTDKRLMPEPKKGIACAVVGFGPSLQATWHELKQFRAIISTSKAHDFLIERGIIPTYHVDCDPRPHKVEHVKNCRSDIRYLLSSTVYPKVLLTVKDCPHGLWNYDVRASGYELPEGEWSIPTYADVSQQAIQIASILGYKNIHLFGVDYSHGKSGEKHAGSHELEYPGEEEFTCNGVPFRSHWEFVKNMMQMPLVIRDNPDIELSVHGDGLLYSYLKAYYGTDSN